MKHYVAIEVSRAFLSLRMEKNQKKESKLCFDFSKAATYFKFPSLQIGM